MNNSTNLLVFMFTIGKKMIALICKKKKTKHSEKDKLHSYLFLSCQLAYKVKSKIYN